MIHCLSSCESIFISILLIETELRMATFLCTSILWGLLKKTRFISDILTSPRHWGHVSRPSPSNGKLQLINRSKLMKICLTAISNINSYPGSSHFDRHISWNTWPQGVITSFESMSSPNPSAHIAHSILFGIFSQNFFNRVFYKMTSPRLPLTITVRSKKSLNLNSSLNNLKIQTDCRGYLSQQNKKWSVPEQTTY